MLGVMFTTSLAGAVTAALVSTLTGGAATHVGLLDAQEKEIAKHEKVLRMDCSNVVDKQTQATALEAKLANEALLSADHCMSIKYEYFDVLKQKCQWENYGSKNDTNEIANEQVNSFRDNNWYLCARWLPKVADPVLEREFKKLMEQRE